MTWHKISQWLIPEPPPAPPIGQVIPGALCAYWKQGMEGEILYAFQPNDGNIIWLKNGHYLTIFGDDKSVLWVGVVQFRPLRWFERHRLPNKIWSHTTQEGISYNQWITWFWQNPPLQATLILPDDTEV